MLTDPEDNGKFSSTRLPTQRRKTALLGVSKQTLKYLSTTLDAFTAYAQCYLYMYLAITASGT